MFPAGQGGECTLGIARVCFEASYRLLQEGEVARERPVAIPQEAEPPPRLGELMPIAEHRDGDAPGPNVVSVHQDGQPVELLISSVEKEHATRPFR